jgi:hypothetical protein
MGALYSGSYLPIELVITSGQKDYELSFGRVPVKMLAPHVITFKL